MSRHCFSTDVAGQWLGLVSSLVTLITLLQADEELLEHISSLGDMKSCLLQTGHVRKSLLSAVCCCCLFYSQKLCCPPADSMRTTDYDTISRNLNCLHFTMFLMSSEHTSLIFFSRLCSVQWVKNNLWTWIASILEEILRHWFLNKWDLLQTKY